MPVARVDIASRTEAGGRHEARRRMLLRGGALCRRGRADAQSAVPLPRVIDRLSIVTGVLLRLTRAAPSAPEV